LPQGQAERAARVVSMVETMESYFGSCTNYRECEAVCPAGITINVIAQMNKDYIRAKFRDRRRLVRQADLIHEG
ncbi:succinate dehydrogenase/fumarate reductase iron-sulfur subunit, partial [bacterium]|nr:succinate dehydrogenase/fumarate reductase iron-sulfur subunit [bacterium]